jgi:hypothetical protein
MRTIRVNFARVSLDWAAHHSADGAPVMRVSLAMAWICSVVRLCRKISTLTRPLRVARMDSAWAETNWGASSS